MLTQREREAIKGGQRRSWGKEDKMHVQKEKQIEAEADNKTGYIKIVQRG